MSGLSQLAAKIKNLFFTGQFSKRNNDGETAETARRMILESIAWLKADGLAKDITCKAALASKNSITWQVNITRPNGETINVGDSWYAI